MRFVCLLTFVMLCACTPTGKVSDLQKAGYDIRHGRIITGRGKNVGYRLSPFTSHGRTKELEVVLNFAGTRRKSKIIPISQERLADFNAALASGRNVERAVVSVAFEVARRSFCPAGPVAVAPDGHLTRFTPDQWASVIGSQANFPKPKGETTKVPALEVREGGATVRLTCDTPNPFWDRPISKVAALSPAELQKRAAGFTHRSYSKPHGTQIEYLSPDGRAFLWYPGNRRVVVGSWVVEPNDRDPKSGVICYSYTNAFNPVLKTSGGRQCVLSTTFVRGAKESLSGDVFGLSSGRIPFVLAKDERTIAQLRGQASN